jgi:hypothetical protein
MDRQVSQDDKRRSLASDNPLDAVVNRLVERGIIKPEEAEDMLALLSAVSDLSETSVVTSNREWLQRGTTPVRRRTPPRLR